MKVLAVVAGGAVGALLRYGISGWVTQLSRQSPMPWGTLTVNVIGSGLLGLLMGLVVGGRLIVPPAARLFLGVGLLGALTTFSTFSYEALEAVRLGDWRVALASVGANVVLGLGACWLGLMAGTRL